MVLCSRKAKKKKKVIFLWCFSGRSSRKTPLAEQPTSYVWASHQLLVGIPLIFIRQPGSIGTGALPLRNLREQLHIFFIILLVKGDVKPITGF
jgi:hypothetical protein